MKTKTRRVPALAEDKLDKDKERKTRLLIALLCVALSGLAVVPFFFMGRATAADAGGLELRMPETHDMHLHYEQMRSFYTGLSAGSIYPRWEEDTNRGFGAPTMSYYPPGVYYVTSLFYAMSGDWIRALLNAHLLMMLASAAAIYIYARQFMFRFAAVTAMAAYIFLPYHLIDQYQRGAIAELLGFIWMPLMLLFGERLFRQIRRLEFQEPDDQGEVKHTSGHPQTPRLLLNMVGLALSYGAFVWSHPPTAYQFTLAFGIFLIALARLRRDVKGLFYAGAAVAMGLAISAAYLYPAAVEQDLIRHEYISETWPYHSTYVFVHQLPYTDAHQPFFWLIDSIWMFGAVMIAVCAIVFLAVKSYRRVLKPALREHVLLWVILGAFATFMMTKLSYPIGRFIPKIDIGVFTWRMLSITTLVLALLAGTCVQAAIDAAKQRQKAGLLLFRSLAVVVAFGGIIFGVGIVVSQGFRVPVFTPSLEHVNFATIPRTAAEDMFALPVVEAAELVEGKGKVFVEYWEPHHRALRAEMSQPDRLALRTFDFPGWTVTVDGQPAQITHGRATRIKLDETSESLTVNGLERPVGTNQYDEALVRANGANRATILADGKPVEVLGEEQLGDILIELPAGTHHIKLDFTDTTPRQTGNILTLVSTFLVVAMMAAALFLKRTSQKS